MESWKFNLNQSAKVQHWKSKTWTRNLVKCELDNLLVRIIINNLLSYDKSLNKHFVANPVNLWWLKIQQSQLGLWKSNEISWTKLQNGTSSLVTLSKDRTIINCVVVYKTKPQENVNLYVDRKKAMLVDKCHCQIFAINCSETLGKLYSNIWLIFIHISCKFLQ